MTGARKSAKYLFLGGMFSKAISLIGSIILARILFPEDYGYLLIAMLITSLVQVIGNMGFENFYLQESIQSDEHEEKILNITFKLRLVTNVLLFLVQVAVSYIVEFYYQQPQVGQLLRIFSVTVLIMPLSQINLYILRKKLNYKPEVYSNMARDISGTVVKIGFAAAGFGVLSFAFGAVIGALLRLVILIRYQRFKPNFRIWDTQIFKQIFYFGKHSLISGLMAYISNQIDKIFLIKYFPITEIGDYNFSNTQANLFFTYIMSPQGSLIVSYTAKYKSNIGHLYDTLKKVGYAVTAIMVPLTIFLVLYADEIILLVFGSKWLGSSDLFQIFLLMYCVNAIVFPMLGLLTGLGYPQVLSRLSVIQMVSMVIILLAVTQYSSKIISYGIAYCAAISFMHLIKANLGLKKLGQSVVKYLLSLKHVFIVGLITLFFLNWYKTKNLDISFKSLVLALFIVVLISVIYHLIFSRKEMVDIVNLVLDKKLKARKVISST